MASIARRYCRRCKDYVRAEKGQINHGLHAVLTILTGLLWAPVWIYLTRSQPFFCDACGSRTVHSKAWVWMERALLAMLVFLGGIIALIALLGRTSS